MSAKRLIHFRPLSDLPSQPSTPSEEKDAKLAKLHSTIMDFDYDGFFEVENIINAIFNGVPVLTEKEGEVPIAQGYAAPTAVTLPFATSLPSASLLPASSSSTSLRAMLGGESSPWPSASTLRSGDGDAQTRQPGKAPPGAKSVENPNPPPNLSTDIGRHLLLAPGKSIPRRVTFLSYIS